MIKTFVVQLLSSPRSPPSRVLREGQQLRAGSSFSEGRSADQGWQGLFGGLRRKEPRRRWYCDFFQQFLGLSRRSEPLPPRLHLPRCGGGSVFLAARLIATYYRGLKPKICDSPESPYCVLQLDHLLRMTLGGPHCCWGVEHRPGGLERRGGRDDCSGSVTGHGSCGGE